MNRRAFIASLTAFAVGPPVFRAKPITITATLIMRCEERPIMWADKWSLVKTYLVAVPVVQIHENGVLIREIPYNPPPPFKKLEFVNPNTENNRKGRT